MRSVARTDTLLIRERKKAEVYHSKTVGVLGSVSRVSFLYQLAAGTCRLVARILKRSTFTHSCQEAHTKEITNTVAS